MSQRQKILVTGGTGQLGSEFSTLAAAYPQFNFLFPSSSAFPVSNENVVRDFFLREHPAFCINCAAYTAVDNAETNRDQAFEVNSEAVGSLAAVCREFNTGFIHVSTDYVFDGTASIPYTEESPTNPVNVYGASKLSGEQLAFRTNTASVIIRTSWVYSAFGKNFVKTMIRLMKEKSSISVVNDQWGCPTYAADLATAILRIITSGMKQPGVYHFSNAGKITWFEFAEAIRVMTASTCNVQPVSTAGYPTPALRPAWSVLDNSKIISTYGIQPTPWRNSLQRCLQVLGTAG